MTQRVCRPMVDVLSICSKLGGRAYNFVNVADNRIKICSLAQIGTFNRRVKYGL